MCVEMETTMVTIFLLMIIYLAFVSLGIPDGVLGVAWPEIRATFGMSLEGAGYFSIIITTGAVFSAFTSGYFIKKFGTGVLVCISCALTGFSLLGFALSPNYLVMAICCIPFGMGAGGVDTALNDYVSQHFTPRQMNWLHASWGIGAFIGPILMSTAITQTGSWRNGYFGVSGIQLSLFVLFVLSIKLWQKHKNINMENSAGAELKKDGEDKRHEDKEKGRSWFQEIFSRKGLLSAMLFFLFYAGTECGLGLWSTSFFLEAREATKSSAGIWVSAFYGCITIGRILIGFIVNKIGTKKAIRIGQVVSFIGFLCLLVPVQAQIFCPLGLGLIGLGFAPMYPCMMQDSPKHFGADFSQHAIGYQMAMANIGATFLPLLIGVIARVTSLWVIPILTMVFFIATVITFFFISKLPDQLQEASCAEDSLMNNC